jgi:chromosome segregation ATPase
MSGCRPKHNRGWIVVNQWGRDGTSAGSSSRSSGGAGVIVATVLALLIGGGGGYGAARFFSGVSTGDLAARDQTIAELRQQVSNLRDQSTGAQTSDNVLRFRVQELQDQVAQLNKANETLKKFADEQAAGTSADAQAEIEALKKTIEQAGDLQAQLSRARRSLKVSELQLIELERTVKTQQDEIRKLRADLAKAATHDDAGNKALSDQIKTLESALATAREQASTVPDLKERIAAAEDELAQKTADASAARKSVANLQKQVGDLQGKLRKAVADAAAGSSSTDATTRLQAELDKTRKDLAALKDRSGDIEGLRKELATAEEQLAGKDTEISVLKTQIEDAKMAVYSAERKASEADMDRMMKVENLRGMRAELEQLKTDLDKLKTENSGLRRSVASLQKRLTKSTPAASDTQSNTGARRDADAVREALADMPGFSRMTPEKQIELAGRLENGECVADALKASLGRVPAIALRNLIRDLGSKC